MGATDISFKLKKEKFPNTEALTKWYRDAVDEATREYGTDAYNGTISTTRGIRVLSTVFKTETEAYNFFEETCQKWGPVLAVTVGEYWIVGGVAAT